MLKFRVETEEEAIGYDSDREEEIFNTFYFVVAEDPQTQRCWHHQDRFPSTLEEVTPIGRIVWRRNATNAKKDAAEVRRKYTAAKLETLDGVADWYEV